MKLKNWKVFLSSTAKDLKEIRDSVSNHLKKLGFEVIRFEDNFRIDPEANVQEVCLSNIKNADMVILLLDFHFGTRFKYDKNISITQAEYREARKLKIPVFQFINENLKEDYFSLINKAKKKVGDDAAPLLILENIKSQNPEYADEIELILFVGEMFNAHSGNFVNFYENKNDLKKKVTHRMQDFTIVLLRKVIMEEINQIEFRDEIKQFWLSIEELLNLKLYQKPRWHRVSYSFSSKEEDLTMFILKWLKEKRHVLIRGKAGAGKTTELSRAFLKDAKCSIVPTNYSFPLFIKLRNLSMTESNILSTKDLIDFKTAELLNRVPFPMLKEENFRFRLYLDGLDEIAINPKEEELSNLLSKTIMHHPLAMTSRNDVANRINGITSLSGSFSPVIEIEDWSPDMAFEFVKRFYIVNRREDLIKSIQIDDIKALLINPLLATILIYLIYEEGMTWPKELKDRSILFSSFLDKWIKREIERLNITSLEIDRMIRELRISWQLTAWEIYKAIRNGESLTFKELKNRIDEQTDERSIILESSCFRSLLVIRPVSEYVMGFVHEQFMEYLIAELFNYFCLNNNLSIIKYLQHAITSEVNDFIKAIWSRTTTKNLKIIIKFLQKIYDSISNNQEGGLQIKANIVYYWSRITSSQLRNDIIEKLRNVSNQRSNPYLRNGALFSLMRLGDKRAEAQLYESLNIDIIASSYNRRLHLEYFGDLEPLGNPPYEDELGFPWNHAYEKLLEHIENNEDERFIYSRRIDIYTIRSYIESRKRRGPIDINGLNRIKNSLEEMIIKWPQHKDIYRLAFKELKILKKKWNSIPA